MYGNQFSWFEPTMPNEPLDITMPGAPEIARPGQPQPDARQELELLTVAQAAETLGITGRKLADITKKDVLCPHRRGGANGRAYLFYRASVEARYAAAESLRVRMTYVEIGALFRQVCGEEDHVLVEKLYANNTLSELREFIIDECAKRQRR